MITLLSSKIETEIIQHFEDNFDITEPQEDYVCEFTFDGFEILVPYTFIRGAVSYKNEWISAERNGVTYSTEYRDKFRIIRADVNPHIQTSANNAPVEHDSKLKKPKLKTLQQEIDAIIEHEERKQHENKKSSEAIRAHNDYLDLNNR